MTNEQRIQQLEAVLESIAKVIWNEDFVYNEEGEDLVMKQGWLVDVIEDMRKPL